MEAPARSCLSEWARRLVGAKITPSPGREVTGIPLLLACVVDGQDAARAELKPIAVPARVVLTLKDGFYKAE